MRCFVTGGAGFIGSNLVKRLLDEGNEIVIFDNLSSGNERNLSLLNVRLYDDIYDISKESKPDIIFHLGIPSSSPMYKQNTSLVSKAIGDFIFILEYAKENNCKIVYASSSSIYNGNNVPYKEDMLTYVTDYYTECRYAIERLAELYWKLHKVKSIGLRLFSVYGPNEKYKQNYANIVTQFLWKIKNEESPVIFGDGSQTRDFVYVDDVVNAFILASKSDIDFDIFNVGTGVSYSFNDIMDLLNEILGTDIKAEYVENPISNYVSSTLANTDKAERALGFKSKVKLEDGIKKIVNHY